MQRGDFLCQLGAVSTSPRAWHGAHDLSSAFLTAVGYVIDLATRNKDADFHERAASGALWRASILSVSICESVASAHFSAPFRCPKASTGTASQPGSRRSKAA